MKIYQIDSSARKKGSTSRALAKKLLEKIKKPGDEVIYRDLDDEMFFVSGLTESGMKIDEKDQTEHHKKMFELSDKLVKELKESDVIIISAPIYNYGPPATLKAWSDLAARIGETFRFKPNGRREGLLKNKRAYLVITSGGTKLNSNEDFLTPWLKFILNFFGINKIDIICADQMALDYKKSIRDAEKQIDNLSRRRGLNRTQRLRNQLITATLVGYTCAGKSTLFNKLTKSNVAESTKAFSTLNPTTRKTYLSEDTQILLSDTVGFITDLPKDLISSFRATLEEIGQSDVLIHVVDVNDKNYEEKISSVENTLDIAGLQYSKKILVFN